MLEFDDHLDYEPDNEKPVILDKTQNHILNNRNKLRKSQECSINYGKLSEASKTVSGRGKHLNFIVNLDKISEINKDPYNNLEKKKFNINEREPRLISYENKVCSHHYVEELENSQLYHENINSKHHKIYFKESDRSTSLNRPYSISESICNDNIESKFGTENLEVDCLANLNRVCASAVQGGVSVKSSSSNVSNKKLDQKENTSEKNIFLENKNKFSKNFTITVSGTNRSLVEYKKQKHQVWSTKVNDILKDDILRLTSEDVFLRFNCDQEDFHSTSSKSSKKTQNIPKEITFKLPLKRPPTRQKSTDNTLSTSSTESQRNVKSSGIGLMSTEYMYNTHPLDDAISLIASTTIEEKEPDNILFSSESHTNELKQNEDVNKVQQWLNTQDIGIKDPSESCDVPRVFKGLCYRHFFNNECCNKCRKSHDLKKFWSKTSTIDELNIDDLKEALNFATSNPIFYRFVYEYFTKTFAKRDMKNELINMVHIFFNNNYDEAILIEGVTNILDSLAQTDLGTFDDAVECLLLGISIKQYPMLGAVIFEVICNKGNIYDYWPIIRRLVLMGEKMLSKLGTKFLINLMKPPVNFQLCREVDKLLQKYNFINMNEIASDIVNTFQQLCLEHGSLSTKTDSINTTIFDSDLEDEQDFPSLQFDPPCESQNEQNLSILSTPKPSINPSGAFIQAKKMMGITINKTGSSTLRIIKSFDEYDSRTCPDYDSNSVDQTSSYASSSNYPVVREYIKEGLLYDSTNDYTPALKKPKIMISLTDYCKRSVDHGTNMTNGRLSGSESSDVFVEDKYHSRNIPFFKDNRADEGELFLKKTDEKPPEFPLFGRLQFNRQYKLNFNLHHLYLEEIDNIDLDKEDIIALNNCIRKSDGIFFLNLLHKYKGPMTIQNFISMTLAHLIGTNQMMAKIFFNLLTNIEQCNPHYYAHADSRVILEVISMNLLFELDKRNLYSAITDLLLTFSNWDSLITSRLFINKTVSLIGRYLFIAKFLVHTKPEFTYEILICENFHLLEDCSRWPCSLYPLITGGTQADFNLRNTILTIFFTESYLLNIIVVIQLYKTALKSGISNFDAIPFIEKMVVVLINNHRWSSLKRICQEIDLFWRHLSKNTLRAFLIVIFKHTNLNDVYKLFHKCVERGIYQKLYNTEAVVHTICIKTNMLDDEIKLILRLYFIKLLQLKNLPSGSQSLKFKIGLPNQIDTNEDIPFLNMNRSVQIINKILRYYLMEICSLESKSSMPTLVEIEKHDLVDFLEKPRSEIKTDKIQSGILY